MIERLGTRCGPDELWVPGMDFDERYDHDAGTVLTAEYPVPTSEELRLPWQQYDPNATVKAAERVLGVYTVPDRKVTGILSVDLCEVLRDTAGALAEATGTKGVITPGNYSKGTWFDAVSFKKHSKDTNNQGVAYENTVVTSVLQVLMTYGEVPPLDGIEEIATLLRESRDLGLYIIANTSTLPGCEYGTIDSLKKYMPGCFDALVLPRNHDGRGPLTKAKALRFLMEEAGVPLTDLPVGHVDDAPHHIQGFRDHYPDKTVGLFSPVVRGLVVQDPSIQCTTPLEAFERMVDHFRAAGAIA